jgi:tight adherence protein C
MQWMFYGSIAFTLTCVLAFILVPILTKPSAEETRLLQWVKAGRNEAPRPKARERIQSKLSSSIQKAKGTVGIEEDTGTRARLASAGFRGADAAELYFGTRILCPLIGIIAVTFVTSNLMGSLMIGGGIGYIGPDMWLRNMVKRRKERIRKGFPDMVDLLTICMDAGLGLDQALLRVGSELSQVQPDISQEITQLNMEQRAGKPRIEAWRSMSDRTQINEVSAFTSMLIQTDRFGTPILAALSRLSNDMRLKRRQRAEEAAAKAKIKILFPLALFIFPCIFIVLLAPAIISIGSTLGDLGK